jgi:hypothetical protein
MRTFLVVLGAVALISVPTRRAAACSHGGAYIERTFVQPADGATGVPTNAEIRIGYYSGAFASEAPPEDLILQLPGGAVVQIDVELVELGEFNHFALVARPRTALSPFTTYELLDRVLEETSLRETHEVFATFTTGEGPDLVAPTFGGIVSAREPSSLDVCDTSSCCGPYTAVHFSLSWEPATDDGPREWVRYDIYRGSAFVTSVAGLDAVGDQVCSGWYMYGPYGDFDGGGGRMSVRAVDIAGNVGESDAFIDVSANCIEPPPPDAGIEDAGPIVLPDGASGSDGGAAVDGGPPGPRRGGGAGGDGGCAVAGARSRIGAGVIASVLLVVIARRRRRNRR